MSTITSLDARPLYDEAYFLSQVDGYDQFGSFAGDFSQLFQRYQRNVRLLGLRPHHRFLEFGCGRGEVCLYHAKQGGSALGLDYSEPAISLAREKARSLGLEVEFIASSFTDFQPTDNSFDRILASEFIEHISKEEGSTFFRTAFRALKPGGKLLVFSNPNTLQRRFGYPVMRFFGFLLGRRLPRRQADTVSEHYRLYHLNEQNYITLARYARKAGFSRFNVGYDIPAPSGRGGMKARLKHAIGRTPARHLFLTNLYVLAEK